MGHWDVKTTLTVHAHLINTDDHTGNMAALGAFATPAKPTHSNNVVALSLRGRPSDSVNIDLFGQPLETL